jgi:hypothetical protein
LELLEVRQTPTVFAVKTALDTVAANSKTGVEAQGPSSLRSAIMVANARPWPGTILLPNGTLRRTIAGSGEDAAAKGDLDIRGDLTIQGRAHTGTFIDGNNLDRVFDVLSGTVSISRLTIEDSAVLGDGRLRNDAGNVTLFGVFVRGNAADGVNGTDGANGVVGISPPDDGQNRGSAIGGGIDNATGSPSLVDSTVRLSSLTRNTSTASSAWRCPGKSRSCSSLKTRPAIGRS